MHSFKLRAITLVVFHTRIFSSTLIAVINFVSVGEKMDIIKRLERQQLWTSCTAGTFQFLIAVECNRQVQFIPSFWLISLEFTIAQRKWDFCLLDERKEKERKDRDRRGEYGRKDLSLYKDKRRKTLCKDFFSPVMVYLRNIGWV